MQDISRRELLTAGGAVLPSLAVGRVIAVAPVAAAPGAGVAPNGARAALAAKYDSFGGGDVALPGTQNLTQSLIGQLHYPQTAGEAAAGVVPTHYQYPPGNVKRYGAVGDGSTDDRAAIQNAIDAYDASWGQILFPAGTYILSSFHPSGLQKNILQMFRSGLHFIGVYGKSIIKLGNNAYTNASFRVFSNYDNANAGLFGVYADISFRDLWIDFNGANNPTDYKSGPRTGIAFADASRASVEHCIFTEMDVNNAIACGRSGRESEGFFVSHNVFLEPTAGNAGNVDHSTVYASAKMSLITDNVFSNGSVQGRKASTACELHFSDSSFSNNTITGYRQVCYLVHDATEHVTVTNQSVCNNVASDLNAYFATIWGTADTDGVNGVTISGNTVTMTPTVTGLNSGCIAIATTRYGTPKNVKVSGNNFRSSGGLHYRGGRAMQSFCHLTDFNFTDNVVSGFGSMGLYIGSISGDRTLTRCHFDNNKFIECGAGDIIIYVDPNANGGAGRISDISVSRNVFENAVGSARPVYIAAAGPSANWKVLDNEFNFIPTKAVAVFAGAGCPASKWMRGRPRVGSDRGDVSVTLVVGVDAEEQRFATTLTANRIVELSTSGATEGNRFRIIRTGLGAFTLAIDTLKTMPAATAAYVEVVFTGSTWILAGYGTL